MPKIMVIAESWGMMKWIVDFIKENQEDWENENKIQEKEALTELENWNRSKSLEKVEKS